MDQQYDPLLFSHGVELCSSNKRKMDDVNMSSLYIMAMSGSLESTPFSAAARATTSRSLNDEQIEAFLASGKNEYQNTSISQILDDCSFDCGEDLASVALVPQADLVADNQGIEWDKVEDGFIMGTGNIDEIPVAAALVRILEDPADYSRSRKRICLEDDHDEGQEVLSAGDKRFRAYQSDQWHQRFQELLLFRQAHGHCLVPHTFRENLPLARWVKRQRYQYKLMKQGHSTSSMSEERAKMLEDVGFVWSSQSETWSERLEELREYKRCYGHCNVPSSYAANSKLATWVKCQRRQCKLFLEQKPSNITLERIQVLSELGFEWEVRSSKKLTS